MKMEETNNVYTSTIDLPSKDKMQNGSIFLAGSIDVHLSGNWRKYVSRRIRGRVIFDPTHNNHNALSNLEMKNHIAWELKALALSDTVLLNLLPNSESPISLVELGLYVKSNKLIVICPTEFYKSRYVIQLCETYNTPIFETIDIGINYYLEQFTS